MSRSAWEAALRTVEGVQEVDTDSRVLTTLEFATMFQLSERSAHRKLKAMVERGLASRARKRVKDTLGTIRVMPAWYVKE